MEKSRVSLIAGKQAGCVGLLSLYATKCEILCVVAYDEFVKQLAKKLNLPTFSSIKDDEFIKWVNKSDLIVSVHGREIVPIEILKIPPLGCINVHPCLYKYKGANPVGRLLRDNNTRASVGVHYMVEKVDAGEVIAEKFVDVSGKNTIGEVYNELYPYYAVAIIEAIGKIQKRGVRSMKSKINLAVLISGRGSNLKAIIDAIKSGYLDKVDLKIVVANKDAPGLQYAKEFGCSYHVIPRIVNKEKIPEEEHDKKVMEVLENYDIGLIALAGYDQILQKEFVNRYEWKIMNIHPSLLPSFGGTLHGQKDALDYGAKISGCTVHFIEEDVDTGSIIIQAAVPVKDDDVPETLADRILEHEHIIYPKAIKLFSENRLKIVGRKVIVNGELNTSFIDDPAYHAKRIGIDGNIIKHLLEECRVYTVLVENITPREAMILKQEMLSLDGDCVVPKECILNNLVFIDVILVGNSIQLKLLVKKLKNQVFNLTKLAEKLEGNLSNIEIANDYFFKYHKSG